MSTSLAIREDQDFFDDKQLAVLRQLGLDGASNADLAVFLHQCQRTGLDPFARQIYMVGRWSREGTKYTIQTGIDGLRLIGRRAADQRRETLGVTDTEWCGQDGIWRDVWLSIDPPAAARVAIIRNGGRFPAIALFHEYAQTKKDGSLTQMWATKGALMVAKCAEALAWRKAFPQDLSGIYAADELPPVEALAARDAPPRGVAGLKQALRRDPTPEPAQSADDLVDAEVVEDPTSDLTPRTRGKLFAILAERGIEDADEQRRGFGSILGRPIASRSELSEDDARAIIDHLSRAASTGEEMPIAEASAS